MTFNRFSDFYLYRRIWNTETLERLRERWNKRVTKLYYCYHLNLVILNHKIDSLSPERRESELAKLNETFIHGYEKALLVYQREMQLAFKASCQDPLGVFRKDIWWSNSSLKEIENLMAIELSAVSLAHAMAPAIFSMISGKSEKTFNKLVARFYRAQYRTRDSRRVKVFFAKLHKELDCVDSEDLRSAFSRFRNQKESEMEAIFAQYADKKGILQPRTCPFWLDEAPLQVEIYRSKGHPTNVIIRDMPSILIFTFRNYFYREVGDILKSFVLRSYCGLASAP